MAITIKRVKNERGVRLDTLKCGDTFLHDNRVGVIVSRNGHDFALDLTTCKEMYASNSFPFVKGLMPDEIVLPVEVEMTYKVVG